MPTILKTTLTALTLFSLFSCASRLTPQQGIPEISLAGYQSLINEKTQRTEVYEGISNILTIQATWLDSQVTDGALSHTARLAQWNEQTYKDEREKRINENAESTRFFVSFFTPEKKYSDLARLKSLWKVFLEVNGQRYEGKAVRVKQSLSEIQVMYPFHNRWSTPYIITFPIATALVENKAATLTFTGAYASTQLHFGK
ncbi:hypothetical protein [Pseudobdellovibrio exovorus]|uniref:Lipoprotein n=1 Tax=Pseudobdellovibrio exovorus JSS TaxID=1184267 RepID=M4VDT0_9BACT|nr:hypothetical protein [Pseudobdellovibrio exovorus]AGH96196.1 hypothetical protein A11Q_1980 [Pseudobdellovibrio exovorus JSS]